MLQAHDQTAQDELENSLATCNLKALQLCIGGPEDMPGISHKLLHLYVDCSSVEPDGQALRFDRKHVVVASRYIADRLAQRIANTKLRWLEKLVTLSMTESAYGATAGAFFESYAHRRIEQGGVFQVFLLLKHLCFVLCRYV